MELNNNFKNNLFVEIFGTFTSENVIEFSGM